MHPLRKAAVLRTGTTTLVAAAVALAIASVAGGAQEMRPLTLLTSAPQAGACDGIARRAVGSAPDTVAARRLASEGADAALLGNAALARARLERAATLAPGLDDIEYQLGRLYEEQGDVTAATASYCRYLYFAPTAADSSEARRRLAGLSGSAEEATSDIIVQLRTGAAYARRGEFSAAASAFRTATVRSPNLAEAYHDQAVVMIAAGNRQQGRDLLDQYLELRPAARNAAQVREQVRILDRARFAPGTALGTGLLPGGGQLYERRFLAGGVIALAAAGATVFAVLQEDEIRTVTGVDGAGNPYSYEARFVERPNLAVGLGAAAGITVLGAVEAWWWANRGQRRASQLSTRTAQSLRSGGSASDRADAGDLRLRPFATASGAGLVLSRSW